jgi:hypothetical protein
MNIVALRLRESYLPARRALQAVRFRIAGQIEHFHAGAERSPYFFFFFFLFFFFPPGGARLKLYVSRTCANSG